MRTSCLIKLPKPRQKSYAQKKGLWGPAQCRNEFWDQQEEEVLLLSELLPVLAKSYQKTRILFVLTEA